MTAKHGGKHKEQNWATKQTSAMHLHVCMNCESTFHSFARVHTTGCTCTSRENIVIRESIQLWCTHHVFDVPVCFFMYTYMYICLLHSVDLYGGDQAISVSIGSEEELNSQSKVYCHLHCTSICAYPTKIIILTHYDYSRMCFTSQLFPLLAGCSKGHSRVDEVQHSASYERGHGLHHTASCRGCGPQTSCARSALFHAFVLWSAKCNVHVHIYVIIYL